MPLFFLPRGVYVSSLLLASLVDSTFTAASTQPYGSALPRTIARETIARESEFRSKLRLRNTSGRQNVLRLDGGGFDTLFTCFGGCCGDPPKGLDYGEVQADVGGLTPEALAEQQQTMLAKQRRLKTEIKEKKGQVKKQEEKRQKQQERVERLLAALQDSRGKRNRPKMVKDWVQAKILLESETDKSERFKMFLRRTEEQLEQLKWAAGHSLDEEAVGSIPGVKGMLDRNLANAGLGQSPLDSVLEKALSIAGSTLHTMKRNALTIAILPFIVSNLPLPGFLKTPVARAASTVIHTVPTPVRNMVADFPMLKPILGAGRTFWEIALLIRYRHFLTLYDDTNTVLQVLSQRDDDPSSPFSSASSSATGAATNASAASPLASVASAMASLRAGDTGADPIFLNSVLSSAWQTIANIIQAKIQENLITSMKSSSTISNIAVKRIDMGTSSPRIEDLRVLPTRAPYELQVTCKLKWVSSGDAAVHLSGSIKPLPVSSQIRIHNFVVELPVWLRIRFDPRQFPKSPITSMVFAATHPPSEKGLSFDISIDDRRITGIYGLKTGIWRSLQMVLKSQLVLPKKITIIDAHTEEPFVERSTSVGMFVFKLYEAFDLPGGDYTGLSDPYVKIIHKSEKNESAQDGPQECRSRVVSQSCNPVWNERFEIYIYDELTDEIEIQVWDEDDFTSDDLLGTITLKMSEIPLVSTTSSGDGERKGWLELSTKGQIRCKYGYHRFVGDEPGISVAAKKKSAKKKDHPPGSPGLVTRVSSSVSSSSAASAVSAAASSPSETSTRAASPLASPPRGTSAPSPTPARVA